MMSCFVYNSQPPSFEKAACFSQNCSLYKNSKLLASVACFASWMMVKEVAFIAGKSENQAAKKCFIHFSIDNWIGNISFYALWLPKLNFGCHGLRTPNEDINHRYLKNWVGLADKISFGRT